MALSFTSLDLSKLIRQFCSVRRFSTIHTVKDENIAEHSASVAMLAILIHQRLPFDLRSHINVMKVCYSSILHDVDEIITGDIPRPTKYAIPAMKNAAGVIKSQAIDKLVEVFGPKLYGINYEKELNDVEATYLKSLDFLSVLCKVLWEVQLSNKDMLDILPELKSYCEKLSETPIGFFVFKNYMESLIEELSTYTNTPTTFRLH